jgi:hypothetical protein
MLERAINFFDMKKAYGIVFFYSLLILINRLKVGVIWSPDTQQYIDKSVIRPPVYPLLMDVFKFIFGSHEFVALVCFQLIFVLISAIYLSNVLRKKFELHPITFISVNLFLSLPLLSISVAAGIHGEIGNKLLTEAISYGFFLFAVSFLVKTLFLNEKRKFLIFLFLISILMLIRTPMIFMYVIAILLVLYLYLRDKNVRLLVGLIVAVIVAFFIADIGERLYHKSVNNNFFKINRDASHMLVGAVYISDERALGFFADKQDREVLKRTYAYLEDKKLLSKNRFEIKRRLVDIYNDHFVTMQIMLQSSFQDVFFSPESDNKPAREDELYIQYESFSRRVVPVIIYNYYKEFSKLMLLKFLYTLNFREGFFIALFLMFPFIRLKHKFKIFAFFVLLMLVMNRLIMTPIIFLGDRYLFYTDILEYVIFIIMAEQYLKNHVFQVDAYPTRST